MSCGWCVSLLQIYKALLPALPLSPDTAPLPSRFLSFCHLAVASGLYGLAPARIILRNMLSLAADMRPVPPHTFPVTPTPPHSDLLMPKKDVEPCQDYQRPCSRAFPLERLCSDLLFVLFEHVCSYTSRRCGLCLDPDSKSS